MTEIKSTNAMVISFRNCDIVAIFASSVTFRNMAIFSLVVTDHSDSDFAVLRPSLAASEQPVLYVRLI